jgi:hypothetical protein
MRKFLEMSRALVRRPNNQPRWGRHGLIKGLSRSQPPTTWVRGGVKVRPNQPTRESSPRASTPPFLSAVARSLFSRGCRYLVSASRAGQGKKVPSKHYPARQNVWDRNQNNSLMTNGNLLTPRLRTVNSHVKWNSDCCLRFVTNGRY